MTYTETTKAINYTRLDECPYYEIYNTNNKLTVKGRNWKNIAKTEIINLLNENKNYEVTFKNEYRYRDGARYGLVVVREI